MPWSQKQKLCDDLKDGALLRLTQTTRLRIDERDYNADRMDEWKGFVKCSDLYKKGILKSKSTKCGCYSTEFQVFKNTKNFEHKETGALILCPRSTCHSKNCIYIIQCLSCKKCYVGKAGEGIGNNRTFADSTLEHINKIKEVVSNLTNDNFYDESGTMIENVHQRLAASRKEFGNESNYTSEVIHFTGLDGSNCHSKVDHPIHNYSTFVVDKMNGLTQSIKESKLCIAERRRQGQLCTFRSGLNDTKDWNRTTRFTLDFGHRVDQNMMDTDRERISCFHSNTQRLLTLQQLNEEEREEILLNDPACDKRTLNIDKLLQSVGHKRGGYLVKKLEAECRRHRISGFKGMRKSELRNEIIRHYNEDHECDIDIDDDVNPWTLASIS